LRTFARVPSSPPASGRVSAAFKVDAGPWPRRSPGAPHRRLRRGCRSPAAAEPPEDPGNFETVQPVAQVPHESSLRTSIRMGRLKGCQAQVAREVAKVNLGSTAGDTVQNAEPPIQMVSDCVLQVGVGGTPPGTEGDCTQYRVRHSSPSRATGQQVTAVLGRMRVDQVQQADPSRRAWTGPPRSS
jgi:hypothetical protein